MSNEPRRDESVERLLRTSMRDALSGPTTACIEAETLAAWADGALAARERERVEAHVSSCANCQALVAAFARSLPEPAGSAAGVAPGFWTPWRLGWITAVATAAAAVTVWISVPRVGQETPAVQTMASRDALSEPGPLPTVPQAKAEAAGTTAQSNALTRPTESRSATALEKSQSPRREVEADQAPKAVVGQSSLDRRIDAISEVPQPAAGGGGLGAALAPGPPASPAPAIQAASGERSSMVARQQLENLPSATGAADRNFSGYINMQPGVAGNNRIGGGGQANYMLDGLSAMDTGNNGLMSGMNLPIDAVAEIKVVTSGYSADGRSSGLQLSAISSEVVPASPMAAAASPGVGIAGGRGGQVPAVSRWRVLVNGQVERFTGSAVTGQPVVINPPAFITAGSAPTPLVCWLVGHAGVVLRTVDGQRFQRLPSPVSADLRAIQATDSRQATVTTVLGAVYATTDGGATWRLLDR